MLKKLLAIVMFSNTSIPPNPYLKAENLKLKSRIDCLKEKIIELDMSRNKLDQYTKRNNIVIQGICATVSDDHLEEKILDIYL